MTPSLCDRVWYFGETVATWDWPPKARQGIHLDLLRCWSELCAEAG